MEKDNGKSSKLTNFSKEHRYVPKVPPSRGSKRDWDAEPTPQLSDLMKTDIKEGKVEIQEPVGADAPGGPEPPPSPKKTHIENGKVKAATPEQIARRPSFVSDMIKDAESHPVSSPITGLMKVPTQFSMEDADEVFENLSSDQTMDLMSSLAEHIAVEDFEIKKLEDEVTRRRQGLDESKVTMYDLMMANNCANGHKFDNGILIKPKLKETIFKGKEVDDNTLFEWLRGNDLGAIIKEAVHWSTLSGTMKDYRDQGNDLPEIFNPVLKKTTAFAGPGKKNFLAGRVGL